MSKSGKIAIMQPYFFPYIGYLQLINSVEVFVLYEHVSFRKRTWINRNRILDKGQGQPVHITVPVEQASSFSKIGDIHISQQTNWRTKIANLVKFNYKKAPYFSEIFPKIEENLKYNHERIHDYNCEIIKFWCEVLEITTTIVTRTNADTIENSLDDRAINNKVEPKTQRIIDLCAYFNKSHYVNPNGGVDLYNQSEFNKFGLELSFLKPSVLHYDQFGHDFIPYLSMIDTLMHLGTDQTKKLIQDVQFI